MFGVKTLDGASHVNLSREALQSPISAPDDPYLHPVDVETDAPGIVDSRADEELHVIRTSKQRIPQIKYDRRAAAFGEDDMDVPFTKTNDKAAKDAEKLLRGGHVGRPPLPVS